MIDQVFPFQTRCDEEFQPERDGDKPPEFERSKRVTLKRALGKNHRETAREQADGRQDRKREDVLGIRATEAFAEVKKIRDDEDGEQRGLRDDEAGHADLAARREFPVGRDRECLGGGGGHVEKMVPGSRSPLPSPPGREFAEPVRALNS